MVLSKPICTFSYSRYEIRGEHAGIAKRADGACDRSRRRGNSGFQHDSLQARETGIAGLV
jgi:hypothetical protein